MQCILYKIYFWKVFSYELQLDMHSYLHKNSILAKSGCYIIMTSVSVLLVIDWIRYRCCIQHRLELLDMCVDLFIILREMGVI
jgi:hypothetical protein